MGTLASGDIVDARIGGESVDVSGGGDTTARRAPYAGEIEAAGGETKAGRVVVVGAGVGEKDEKKASNESSPELDAVRACGAAIAADGSDGLARGEIGREDDASTGGERTRAIGVGASAAGIPPSSSSANGSNGSSDLVLLRTAGAGTDPSPPRRPPNSWCAAGCVCRGAGGASPKMLPSSLAT